MGSRQTERLLLVGLDGADWKLIQPLMAVGRMPFLKAFLDEGISGNIATLKPTLSPILWQSIATGKRAAQHGIHGFTEVNSDSGKVQPVSRSSRKCAAIWDILASEGLRCHVINWFASHPARPSNGVCFSDLFAANMPAAGEPWKLLANSFAPMAASPEIEALRLHASELPIEFLRLFIPKMHEIDFAQDRLADDLARELATASSIQAAALWSMENHPWDFTAVYYRIIDLIGHYFMKFHPPQYPGVDERQYDLYHDVVNGAYQMFDLMFANLLKQVGPEDTVILVSDHGFHRPSDQHAPDTLISDPESWHRDYGVLAMRGPGIKSVPNEPISGEAIFGAGLLDITPTILQLFGLPVGQDMRGRVLSETLKNPAPADFIETWEERVAQSAAPTGDDSISAEESVLILKQMEQLGYISQLSKDQTKASQQVIELNNWQLALDHLDAREFEEALPLIECLVTEHPGNLMYRMRRAVVLWRLGLNAEAGQEIKHIMSVTEELPLLSYLRGQLALESKDYGAALTHFRSSAATQDSVTIQLALGQVFLSLEQWGDAEQAYKKAMKHDGESAVACHGLAIVYQRRGDWMEASQAAFQSLRLVYNNAAAHFTLGWALERMDLTKQAITAFEGCLKFNRHHSGAHRCLARLLARTPGNETRIEFHRACIDQRKDIYTKQRARISRLRESIRSGALLDSKSDIPPVKPVSPATPSSFTKSAPVSEEFVIVTGLPRSGTSLMMQILAAGGMKIKTDHIRISDENNEEGYYEWEGIKALPENPSIIQDAKGQVTKVVTPLIPFLPAETSFRVIQMYRPINEVARSQNAMLQRINPEAKVLDEARLARMLASQESSMQTRLKENPLVDLLVVPYQELVDSPTAWIESIRNFIGQAKLPHGQAMHDAVKPGLYRIRI